MNRDARGVLRGACTCGDCDVYMSPTDGLKCAYCDCVPAKHANLTKDINASRLVSETTVHSDKVQERKKEDVPFIKKEDVPFIKKEDVPFIKKEDVPFIKKEDVPFIKKKDVPFIKKKDVQKELHVPHAASDPSQTSTEKIDNQPAKTIAFNVPEVGSSSYVHLQEQVSSAHRPKSSGVRKRHLSDPGGNEESKKQKQQTHHKVKERKKENIPFIKKEDVPFIRKEDVPFIKKEDVPFIKKEDVPFIKKKDVPFIRKEDVQKELHVPHAASDPSQTSTGQIDNQPAKTIAFNVPEVGSSSDVHLQEQVSSAHRFKSSGVRKRHASDPGGNEESMRKKQKQQTHQKQDKISTELIEMKPCKLLHLGHMPCTEIPPPRGENKVKGVFKIAYKWETIYVGASTDCVFKQLRRQFSGNGKQDLFNFLNDLDIKELENVSFFWLDDSKHTHSCGKKSYQECIGKLQGQKPRFNTRSVPERPKAEAPNNDTLSSTSMPGSANPIVSSSDEVDEYQKNSNSVAKQKSPSDDSSHYADGMYHAPEITTSTVAVDPSQHFPESHLKKETKERTGNELIISNKTGSSKQEPEKEFKKHQILSTGAPCKNAGTDKSQISGQGSCQLGKDNEISPIVSILPRSTEFIDRIFKEKRFYKNEPRKPDQQLPKDTSHVLENGQSLLNTNTYSPDKLNSAYVVCTTDTRNTKEKTCHKTKQLTSLLLQPRTKTCPDAQQNKGQMSSSSKSNVVANDKGLPKSDVLATIMSSMDELVAPVPSGKDKVTSSKTEHKTPTVRQRVEDKHRGDSTSTSNIDPECVEVKDKHKGGSTSTSNIDPECVEVKDKHRGDSTSTSNIDPVSVEVKDKHRGDSTSTSNIDPECVEVKDKHKGGSTSTSNIDPVSVEVKDKHRGDSTSTSNIDLECVEVKDKHKGGSTSTSNIDPVSAEVKDKHTNNAKYNERSSENLAKTQENINSENYRHGNTHGNGYGLTEDQLSRSNFDSVGLRTGRQSNRASNQQDIFPARQQVMDSQMEAISSSRQWRYSEPRETEVNRKHQKEWSNNGRPRSSNERSKHHRHHRPRRRDDRTDGKERADWSRSSSHHIPTKTSTPRHHHTSDSRKSTYSNSDGDMLPQIYPPRFVKEYNHTLSPSYPD